MKKFFTNWLPSTILMLIPLAFLIMNACGYDIYIINGEKAPWIINTSEIVKIDSLNNDSLALLNNLKSEGLVLTPQEFSSHTYTFFSWLLTILVAVIGIVVLVFGLNIDKHIEDGINEHLKKKWIDLMRTDKEVDSTIGGLIDDKYNDIISGVYQEIDSIKERLDKTDEHKVTFKKKIDYGKKSK